MSRTENERNFGADIPRPLWERYEAWAERRPKISNRQLQVALFRIFLAVPEELKRRALFGSEDDLTEIADRIESILAAGMDESAAARTAEEKRRSRDRIRRSKAG